MMIFHADEAKLRDELFAFPRIGRADPPQYQAESKRTGPKPINNGLWFGPRLGRVQKRNPYANLPEGYLINPAESSGTLSFHYAPRPASIKEEEDLFMDALQQEPSEDA